MFEVQDLKFATLATVSRCGMVWFSEDVLTTEMIFESYLLKLRNVPVEEGEEDISFSARSVQKGPEEEEVSPTLLVGCVSISVYAHLYPSWRPTEILYCHRSREIAPPSCSHTLLLMAW